MAAASRTPVRRWKEAALDAAMQAIVDVLALADFGALNTTELKDASGVHERDAHAAIQQAEALGPLTARRSARPS